MSSFVSSPVLLATAPVETQQFHSSPVATISPANIPSTMSISPTTNINMNSSHKASEDVFSKLNQVSNLVDQIWTQLKHDELIVFQSGRIATVKALVQIELLLRDITSLLSYAAQTLLTSGHCQSRLASITERLKESIGMMRITWLIKGCGLCCAKQLPFYGDRKIQQLATSIEALVKNCQSTASLSFDLVGKAQVSGVSGATVHLQNGMNTALIDNSPNIIQTNLVDGTTVTHHVGQGQSFHSVPGEGFQGPLYHPK